jgi:hypothetical protein
MGREFPYVTPVALQKDDTITVQDPISARFIIGGDDRIVMCLEAIRFDEQEPEWFTISDEDHNGFEGTPQCMDLSTDANHLFVGTLEGGLFRISNIKYSYDYETADVNSPFSVISTSKIPVYLPGTTEEIDQVITSVAVDPNDANRVIITLGNYGNEHYVYMSTNALDENPEFVSIQGNLPQAPVYSSLIEMDPDNNLVFLGTEYGIYVSQNTGANNPTWTQQNGTMGEVPVMMIRQQKVRKETDVIPLVDPNGNVTNLEVPGNNNYGVIYAATFGRGMVSLDEFQKPVGIDEPVISKESKNQLHFYPNPVINQAFVEIELETASSVVLNIYDLSGQVINTIDKGLIDRGKHTFEVNSQGMAPGTYILEIRNEKISKTAKFIVY